MASLTPAAVQNENLHAYRGKGVDGEKAKANALKPVKALRQERKALRDISKAGKPSLSTATKVPKPKDKSATHGRETAKKALKTNILTNEEMEQCREWAKEGIEHMHFSGNDMQNLENEKREKRVAKKVEKAMSALHGWTDDLWTAISFGLESPVQDAASDTDDILKLEILPEMLPSLWTTSPTKLGNEENDIFEVDFGINDDDLYFRNPFEAPKLKENYDSDNSI